MSNWFHVNYFVHAANIVLLIAYSVRDILWLRILALISSFIAIPYFLLQPVPLWAPLGWTVVFAGVNLVQSLRLVLERRPVKLTAEEEQVRRLVFPQLPPRKVLDVLRIGQWTAAESGERLIKQGRSLESISLLIRGRVRVTLRDRFLGYLVAGNIVGSGLLLSGVPSEVDATVEEYVHAVTWDLETLQKYLAANPETRLAMQKHLMVDLASKIEDLSRTASPRAIS
jgi:CRP-like cAMP-binding protein